MATIDPTTGQPLPADAIQRLLFVAAKVHVYQIPPLTSTKGYTAATWTTDPTRHIFTARLRILETGTDTDDDTPGQVKVDVVLEDPATGQLFAAAPYTAADVVEAALDSARFYAVRVQDPQGRKAMLGIGFEERPESFDFGVALQEARRTLGWEGAARSSTAASGSSATGSSTGEAPRRDYSLKEGETITVNLGTKFGRRATPAPAASSASSGGGLGGLSGFSLPPPPPPPPATTRRAAARRSVGDPSLLGNFDLQKQREQEESQKKAAALGFDDGQNGEFA